MALLERASHRSGISRLLWFLVDDGARALDPTNTSSENGRTSGDALVETSSDLIDGFLDGASLPFLRYLQVELAAIPTRPWKPSAQPALHLSEPTI
jgi:hypothetical protein